MLIADVLYADQTPVISKQVVNISQVKYDPLKESLQQLIDSFVYKRGSIDSLKKSLALDTKYITNTSAFIKNIFNSSSLINEYTLSIPTIHETIWLNLPKISDYTDVESLYDIDEVETAFYKATKNLGW